ncbi:hypothetical protein DCAR_0518676 [Daucus carota subsp. sativus]|uniref:Uncharacterized protein n=1 Tax=Daucus carota subsp. sativus TaxID=79200 RepID=A0AAF1AXS8_DAUCS|nr:PREDICTED: uncharacterized protein LOC108222432 [Daucus carota subsp. sativus]WOG99328.1 hypothetical protein DCAR_0518676 [Daucus carota subsp. sativus]
MATSASRGAQTMNSVYLKPMLRKAYHRKSGEKVSDGLKKNEDRKMKDGNWWIRDDRTGIFYPKGQEKVMEDVPLHAGRDFGVNWLSNSSHTARF